MGGCVFGWVGVGGYVCGCVGGCVVCVGVCVLYVCVIMSFYLRGFLFSRMMLGICISVQVNNVMLWTFLQCLNHFFLSPFLNLSYFTSKDEIPGHLSGKHRK